MTVSLLSRELPRALLDTYGGAPCAVLGASGFIGRWLTRHLSRCGADLLLLVRDARTTSDFCREADIDDARIVAIDLADHRALADAIRATRPAIVFNLAGYGVDPAERDPAAAELINSQLPQALAEIVASIEHRVWPGQQLVHVGSALEYGTASGFLDESGPATPTTLYGQTKLAGTLAVQEAARQLGIRAVVARLFTVYGLGEHAGRLLPSLLQAAATSAPLPLTEGLQKRDFNYVEDVAEGLLRLGASPSASGRIVNLATGRLTSVRDFIDTAAGILSIPRQNLLYGALPARPEEMSHAGVLISELIRITDWSPATSIAHGVALTQAHEAAAPATGRSARRNFNYASH